MLTIKICESCGRHYDELVIARLVLVSGRVVYRYLCCNCVMEIKKIRYGGSK